MLFQLVPGGFSYLVNQNNCNSNQKKLLGFRNMQEMLENMFLQKNTKIRVNPQIFTVQLKVLFSQQSNLSWECWNLWVGFGLYPTEPPPLENSVQPKHGFQCISLVLVSGSKNEINCWYLLEQNIILTENETLVFTPQS